MKSSAHRITRPAVAKKKKPTVDATLIPAPTPREKPTQFFLAAKLVEDRSTSPVLRRRHE